jgi:hypothetical protein
VNADRRAVTKWMKSNSLLPSCNAAFITSSLKKILLQKSVQFGTQLWDLKRRRNVGACRRVVTTHCAYPLYRIAQLGSDSPFFYGTRRSVSWASNVQSTPSYLSCTLRLMERKTWLIRPSCYPCVCMSACRPISLFEPVDVFWWNMMWLLCRCKSPQCHKFWFVTISINLVDAQICDVGAPLGIGYRSFYYGLCRM